MWGLDERQLMAIGIGLFLLGTIVGRLAQENRERDRDDKPLILVVRAHELTP